MREFIAVPEVLVQTSVLAWRSALILGAGSFLSLNLPAGFPKPSAVSRGSDEWNNDLFLRLRGKESVMESTF